jgi:hypothetical protein
MQRSLLLEDMYMNFKKTHDMKEMGFSKKETLETIDESLKSMNMDIKLVTEITKKIDTYNFTPEILLNYMKVMDFMYYRYLSTIAGKIVARYTKTITIDCNFGFQDPKLKNPNRSFRSTEEYRKMKDSYIDKNCEFLINCDSIFERIEKLIRIPTIHNYKKVLNTQ